MTEIEYLRKCSRYLDILLGNNPDYVEWLLGANLNRKYPLTGIYSALVQEAAKARSFQDLLRIFRRFKQLHFLRIGARDLLHRADLTETTGQLSDLASVALQVGLEVLSAHPDWWAAAEDMDAWRKFGGKVPLVVMGLGKLGGYELNYVSDIDLIFLYTGGDEERADCVVPLSRLTNRLDRLLSDQFEGDRVFRVDFRLRPLGKQGILVPSMSGAVEHYLLHGRAWERQMLLKCRPVAGERSEGTAFVRELRPFVFRRFLDFQAIDELRMMRTRILTEAFMYKPGAKQFDVKLGIGGIREVEFLVQSLQLIYGGRDPELDEPNTLKCLEKLVGRGLLPRVAADELKTSYTFLRNLEHYIQLDQNRQTQRMPESKEELARLVFAMGFGENRAAFLEALQMHCAAVHSKFQELFHEKHEPENDNGDEGPLPGPGDHGRSCRFPEGPLARLEETLKGYPTSVRSEIVCGALEKFAGISDRDLQEKILARLDAFFGRVVRRTGLTRLFETVHPWLVPFCRAIGSSELLASLLSHNPALVEGHAMRAGVFSPAPEWEASAANIIERTPEYAEKLEWIRRLKNERMLQLALADLDGRIDFGALEEEQTSLAEFVIRNTLAAVRQNLDMPADLPLSVLGMGKLGSGEMSYLSDLDLVFVYSPKPGEPADRIPAQVVRLIQRLMNMLATPLQEGPGYPMDARLRPTGTHGPLVVTKETWLDYYVSRADIWEIQALIRMRPLAGDPGLGTWLDEKAAGICCRKRPPESVWPRICHLRHRMEKERAAETDTEIDLKLGMGGLADIEFIVQGLVLERGQMPRCRLESGESHPGSPSPPSEPGIPFRPGLNRSLRWMVRGVFDDLPGGPAGSDELSARFRALRALDHRVRLHTNSSAAKLDEQRFETMVLLGLWPPHVDGSSIETWQDVLRLRREVRAVFSRFC